ncbi:MAG: hypothetical protein ACTSQF_01830 [Candidatus Heimdallarchaeaceae archaeon]
MATLELGTSQDQPQGTSPAIQVPATIPADELIGQELVTPTANPIEIPDIEEGFLQNGVLVETTIPIQTPLSIPSDGIVLLETIEVPIYSSEGGVTRLIELRDVDSTRVDGDILVYQASTGTYIHTTSSATATFISDILVTLSSGKNFGKYLTGETIPAAGKTFEQVLNDIAIEYIDASFTSFSVSGQATTVEVGTTLSGSKTFTWAINEGSGSVNTIDIYDYTDSSYIQLDTPNDGSQVVTINSNQLNTESETQRWRGIGLDETPNPDVEFNSSLFTVTGLFYRFYGPTASSPTNSATVRALPSSAFQSGSDVFNLNTGSTEIKFVVALPPGHTITEVIDLDALGADITSEYIAQSSIDVLDAGGTNRAYNIYEMNVAIPYSSNHRHQITTT